MIVAAAGNTGQRYLRRVAYPARATDVIAVGATTRRGCQAEYSNSGPDLDVVAPGGGDDAEPADPAGGGGLPPRGRRRWIYQQTFTGAACAASGCRAATRARRWPPARGGIAALIIATHKLGEQPEPDAGRAAHRGDRARPRPPGFDSRYGSGLVDAARALRCPAYTAC